MEEEEFYEAVEMEEESSIKNNNYATVNSSSVAESASSITNQNRPATYNVII